MNFEVDGYIVIGNGGFIVDWFTDEERVIAERLAKRNGWKLYAVSDCGI